MSEQILIRGLPEGTKQALRSRAARLGRSVEAEARAILATGVQEHGSIVSFLAMPGGDDIEFQPDRLGATARVADL